MKRNIRLTIEYDGSRYQGWQRLGGDSNANTIQGKLESVLSKMTGEDVNINGSGRTDAGVHAYGQVANFHTDCMMSVNEIKNYLTKYLPSDIGIVEVSEASERFHSRLNAKEKTYWNFSRSWMWKNKTRGYSKSTGKYKKKRCRDYCTASRVISGFCGVLRSNLILPRLPQQFLSLILVLPTVLLLLIYYRSHKKQIHTVGLGIVFPKECILLPV